MPCPSNRSRGRSAATFVVAAALAVITPGLAAAQGASAEEIARDRARFAEAVELADAERYTEALEIFEDLQRSRPHPAILYNIAWCLSRLDRAEEALARFDEYLATGDSSSSRREAAEAERSRLADAVEPPPPEEPESEAEPEAVGAPTSPPEAPPPRPSRRRPRPGWFWATLGLTLVTGAAMATTGSLTLWLSDRWINEGDVDDRDTGRALRTATDILLITTVVEAIAALVLGLVTDFQRVSSSAEAPTPP